LAIPSVVAASTRTDKPLAERDTRRGATVAFLDVDVGPRRVTRARVPMGEFSDGTQVTLPVVAVNGAHDGPTLYVQAGLHGDEQTGIAVCRTFLESLHDLDLDRLAGRLVVVPIANPPSHLTRSRGYLHEERRMIDLNRIFPGDRDGLLSERIANTLFEEFVRPADFCVDLHSALEGCTIAPFVYVDPDDDDTGTRSIRERLALAFGTPFVYYRKRGTRFGTSDISHGLMAQADAIGKPAIIAEMGQSQVVTRDYVPVGVTGLHNVMRALGMLEGEPVPTPEQRHFSQIHLVHATRGGGLETTVSVGELVSEGDLLGRVVDVFGQTVEEFKAPTTGFVLRLMLWGAVATGAEFAWIGA
jgi:predicted deacylase